MTSPWHPNKIAATNLIVLVGALLALLWRHQLFTFRHAAELLALCLLWANLSRLAELMLWEAAGVGMVVDTEPRRQHWQNVETFANYLAEHDISLAQRAREVGVKPRNLRSALRREPSAYRRPSISDIQRGLANSTWLLIEFMGKYE